jgi:hypothetical protein
LILDVLLNYFKSIAYLFFGTDCLLCFDELDMILDDFLDNYLILWLENYLGSYEDESDLL